MVEAGPDGLNCSIIDWIAQELIEFFMYVFHLVLLEIKIPLFLRLFGRIPKEIFKIPVLIKFLTILACPSDKGILKGVKITLIFPPLSKQNVNYLLLFDIIFQNNVEHFSMYIVFKWKPFRVFMKAITVGFLCLPFNVEPF